MFGVSKVVVSNFNVMIELWLKIVWNVFSGIVPLSLRFFSSHDDLVVVLFFSDGN